MNKLGRRQLILLCIIVASLALSGCVFQKTNKKLKADPKSAQNPPKGSANTVQTEENSHPYGNPYKGALPWEETSEFKAGSASGNMKVRMAAFRTTLPDPLPGEEANVALAAQYLKGTVVKPGGVFSMNGMIGPYSKARGFQKGPAYYGPQVIKVTGGGVCKIASTLYNCVILADLKVVERHPHSMPVPYVPPGQDATVSSHHKDFRFLNNSSGPVLIWAQTRGNTLYMAFYGQNQPPKVSWQHQILSRQPFPKFERVNRSLKPGETKVIIPGAEGLAVRSHLTILYPDGRSVQKDLGVDYYKPLPHVVEKGL